MCIRDRCEGGVDSTSGPWNIPAACLNMPIDVCISAGLADEPSSWMDCDSVCFGTAFIDILSNQGQCANNYCIGGDTGITPTEDEGDVGYNNSACTRDCNNEPAGFATIDSCSDCVGGNTSHEANTWSDPGQAVSYTHLTLPTKA